MRRVVTGLLAAVVIALAAAVGLGAGSPAVGSTTPLAVNIAKCVKTSKSLSVVVLMDESGSLASTDPQASRVDGLGAALSGLAQVASSPGKPRVEVQLVGFSGNTESATGAPGWQQVTPSTLPRLLRAAASYAVKDHGQATDFGLALGKARSLLAARAAGSSGGAAPCQAIVWFTDGTYDVVPGAASEGGSPSSVPYAPGVAVTSANRQAVISAGQTYLCKRRGLMDQLAQSGVGVFAIGLSSGVQSGSQNFLQAAATGAGGSYKCGSALGPQTGAYLPASDGSQLFFAFGNLLTSDPGSIRHSTLCAASGCRGGWNRFSTLPGIARFDIRIALPASGAASSTASAEVQIQAPGGGRVTLKPSGPTTGALDGASINATWISPRSVQVVGAFRSPASAPTGRWSYGVTDSGQAALPGGVLSQVELSTDLAAVVSPPAEGLLRGGTTPITVKVEAQTPNETPAPALIARAHPGVSVNAPAGGPQPTATAPSGLTSDGFTADVSIPEASPATAIDTSVLIRFASPSDAPIQPVVSSVASIPTRLATNLGFPSLSPTSLALPVLSGLDGTSGTLTLKPNPDARSCVWFGAGTAASAPPEAGRITLTATPAATSKSSCIELPAGGEPVPVTVAATSNGAASGHVAAVLDVHAVSKDGKEQAWDVPVSFEMAPAPNVPVRIALVVVLVLIGLLLPFAFLYVINRWTSRFTNPEQLSFRTLRATLAGGRLTLRDLVEVPGADGYSEEWARNWQDLAVSGDGSISPRRLVIHGINFTIVSMGWRSPFRAPYGLASSGGHPVVAGSPDPAARSTDGRRAEVPLSLAGTWVFLPVRVPVQAQRETADDSLIDIGDFGSASASGGTNIEGDLVLIVSQIAGSQQPQNLWADAQRLLQSIPWDQLLPADQPPAGPAPEHGTSRSSAETAPGENSSPPAGSDQPPASDDDLVW